MSQVISSETGKSGLQRSIQLLIDQYADEHILSVNDSKAINELEKIRKYITDEKNIDLLADDIKLVFSRLGLSSVKNGTIARYLDEFAQAVKQKHQEFRIIGNSICRYDCSKQPSKRLTFISSSPETITPNIGKERNESTSVTLEDEFEPGSSKICISTDKSLCHVYIIGSFIGFTKYDYKIFEQNHIDRVVLFIENNGSFIEGESGSPEHFNWRYYQQNNKMSITPIVVIVAAILLIYIGRKAKILE